MFWNDVIYNNCIICAHKSRLFNDLGEFRYITLYILYLTIIIIQSNRYFCQYRIAPLIIF